MQDLKEKNDKIVNKAIVGIKSKLNQSESVKCGDNGIFKGVPLTQEQKNLSSIARYIYKKYPTDGKYILDKRRDACFPLVFYK